MKTEHSAYDRGVLRLAAAAIRVFVGIRWRGVVHRCDDTDVATRFICVLGIALLPRETNLRAAESVLGPLELPVPARLRLLSLLAAYTRAPIPVLAVACILWSPLHEPASAEIAVAIISLILGHGLGRLGRKERERRRAYRATVGASVDVALLGTHQQTIRDRAALLLDSSRSDAPPESEDRSADALTRLEASLVILRIDASRAQGAQSAELERQHDALLEEYRERMRASTVVSSTVLCSPG